MASLLSRAFLVLALSSSLVVSAPVSTATGRITESGRTLGKRHGTHLKVKRAEAGPELGGMNFPDPSVHFLDNTWYAFATDGNNYNVQMASSPDFNTWTYINSDAMPTVGAWVNGSAPAVWAPDVVQVVGCLYLRRRS